MSIQTNFNPHYRYPNKWKQEGDSFFQSYRFQREIFCPDSKMKQLKDKKLRTCRFCKKGYPLVSFDKDAHVLSNLLGNRYLVADDECDACNQIFGRYENDLAAYLGITRTIQSARAKERVPKFKSADNTLRIESRTDTEEGPIVMINRFDSLDQTFTFDKENAQTVITYTKQPYKPLFVYKALLKMALSSLPYEEMENYTDACRYLLSEEFAKQFKGFAVIAVTATPLTYGTEIPLGMLFQKVNAQEGRFTHVFAVHALNMILQIVIPFNIRDRWFFKDGASLEPCWCPPIFGEEYPLPVETIQSATLDFNSPEKIKGVKESFRIPGDEASFNTLKFKNKLTGEVTEEPFDPSKILGISLQRIK